MSIGESLAEARRQGGHTIADVSQQTRIRESIIRGIEHDDFSACGGDFYARGHIRSIARAIGTDPAPLIREYDSEHGPLGTMRAAEVFEPSTPIKIRERRSPSLSMIVAVALLAVIGFSVYRLVGSHHGGSRAHAAVTHSAPARGKPVPRPSPTPLAARSDVVIHVSAVQACWVLLTKSSDGSQIYMGVIPAGSSRTWTEKQAVNMRLGNPPGVVLTVDGKRRPTNVNNPETLSFSPRSS